MRLKLIISIVFLVCLVGISRAGVTGPSFSVYIGDDGVLGFQSENQQQVNLTITSGALNCSNASIRIYSDRGLFQFMSNESLTFTLAYDVSKVQVDNVVIDSSGLSYSYVQNDLVKIEWWNMITPYVPYLFILGMIGLCCMFGGPLLTIRTMKENPRWAITLGATFTTLGIGLFMAWLSS